MVNEMEWMEIQKNRKERIEVWQTNKWKISIFISIKFLVQLFGWKKCEVPVSDEDKFKCNRQKMSRTWGKKEDSGNYCGKDKVHSTFKYEFVAKQIQLDNE